MSKFFVNGETSRLMVIFRKDQKPKVERLSEGDIHIINELHESSVSAEDIALVMDLSVSRVNYEIKQMINRGFLNRSLI